jgi:hypothetical protein
MKISAFAHNLESGAHRQHDGLMSVLGFLRKERGQRGEGGEVTFATHSLRDMQSDLITQIMSSSTFRDLLTVIYTSLEN